MPTDVIVNVELSKLPLTLGPGNGNVKFEYKLASYKGVGKVKVYPDGTIDVTGAEKQLTLKFVPQTANLTWGNDSYDVSVKPPPLAEEMLWISETKPTTKWTMPTVFTNFSWMKVAGKDSIVVDVDRTQFTKPAYYYGLAFNAVDRTGVAKLVRDDPQIKDRGVPNYHPALYVAAALGILGAATLTYVIRRRMHQG